MADKDAEFREAVRRSRELLDSLEAKDRDTQAAIEEGASIIGEGWRAEPSAMRTYFDVAVLAARHAGISMIELSGTLTAAIANDYARSLVGKLAKADQVSIFNYLKPEPATPATPKRRRGRKCEAIENEAVCKAAGAYEVSWSDRRMVVCKPHLSYATNAARTDNTHDRTDIPHVRTL